MSPGPEQAHMQFGQLPWPFYEFIRFYPVRVSKLAREY